MGKCAALIVGCGTIFGLFLCGFWDMISIDIAKKIIESKIVSY